MLALSKCDFTRCGWVPLFSPPVFLSSADHDVSVPHRSAFEQDVEHGNTDGLGDCQSKRGPFTLIFPPQFPPCTITQSFSFLDRPFPSRLPSPFCAPSVPSSQSSSLLAFSIHLSLSAPRPPASVPLLRLCSHKLTPPHSTPLFQTGPCVHSGSFLADGCGLRYFFLLVSVS